MKHLQLVTCAQMTCLSGYFLCPYFIKSDIYVNKTYSLILHLTNTDSSEVGLCLTITITVENLIQYSKDSLRLTTFRT